MFCSEEVVPLAPPLPKTLVNRSDETVWSQFECHPLASTMTGVSTALERTAGTSALIFTCPCRAPGCETLITTG